MHCVRRVVPAPGRQRLLGMKRIVLSILVGVANANLFAATNSIVLTPALINQFAEEMRAHHPALAAARARTNAAVAGIGAVSTWDDPMLKLGAMASEERMRRDDGDIIYGIEQKLPLFGKAKAARAVATTELGIQLANESYQFQILRRELAKAVFQAALAERIVAIGEQDFAWVDLMTSTTEERYRSSVGRLTDVLQMQNERSKRAEQLETDRQNLAHARFVLNRMLGRELDSPWPSLELPEVSDAIAFSPSLVTYALRNEPKLRVMRAQIKQADASVDAARRSRFPEISAGIESRNYSGNAEWRQAEFALSFSLPFVNRSKYRAEVQRETAKREAAEFDARDYEQSIREEVHGLTIKINAARREAVLYRDQIIPRSEQALASAQAMLESSSGMVRDALEARRMLLEGRLMYARAVTEQYQMLSELVLCCGVGDLEALQMLKNNEPVAPLPKN
jgi:cobalt-zinc-cadmium efflux system outer membrane protein